MSDSARKLKLKVAFFSNFFCDLVQPIYDIVKRADRVTCIVFFVIVCWLERRTRDQKVARSNPGRSGRRIFFSRVNFVCWLLFGVRSIRVLLQWHVKDPGHSAKSASGRLRINTHTPLTQRSWSGPTMPLSRHNVGTYPERAHTQLVREHSATVVSVHWATVDWSWPKEWN